MWIGTHKSASGKIAIDLLQARFWSEAHVQEADFPSKWTRAGIPRAQFLVSGETAELPRMRARPMCLVHRIAGGKSRIAERLS